jgi:hypothetical protein
LAAALATAFVLGLADYWLHFKDTGLRVMATTTLALVVAWVAYRTWYVPSRSKLAPLDVARRVEAHFPQLQDSLASAVEFLEQSEEDITAGSAQLRRLVVAAAQNTTESLPLNDVVDRRPLRRAAIACGCAALVAGMCIALDAASARTALARLVAPWGSAQWPRQNHLAFREVPKRLAAGQSFEFELTDSSAPLPDDVRFEFGVAGQRGREVTTEPMVRSGDVMIARRENIQRSFAFRAAGGDDDTMPWHWVEVVEPPRLESLAIVAHPPKYSGLSAKEAERHIEVLAGTGIEVSGVASKRIHGARIIQDGVPPIDAKISADAAGNVDRAFHIAPEQWVAAKSGAYRLELVDEEDIAGTVGQWNLRVEADSPPSISWQEPADDIYVLPAAVVPLQLAVKDNLAIRQVTLKYERTDRSEADLAANPQEPPIVLYSGPAQPSDPASANGERAAGESVHYDWDLAALKLPVGAQITMQAEAEDYQPAVGRTASPRRISIIDAERLESRLADRQTQIVRQLERALAAEQTTREDVRRLAIEQQDTGSLGSAGRNAVQSAELNQRRVARMLIDPAEGISPMVDSILREIAINRVENSATRDTMERLAGELNRLAEPLGVADQELTTVRKSAESVQANDAKQSAATTQSLANVGTAQDDVIATLERLVSELSGKSDARRFARLLAELKQDQISHEKQSRSEIGLETLPLATSELTRAQRATLNKAAAGEEAIAGRYDKIEQGLDQLAVQLRQDRDPTAGTLADAVDLARRLNIGLDMRQSTGDLRENRVGQALERETRIAQSLQQVLDALRNEGERKPDKLVDKLRDAEQELAKLREQTAALRQQIEDDEKKPATTNAARQGRLGERQQQTREAVDKLSREVERLQAAEASKSMQSAAKKLENQNAGSKAAGASPPKQPSPSSQVKKAEEDLKQAAEQLAQRRQQAEDDLELEMVRRFQAELAEMVKQQQRVICRTVELEDARGKATLTKEQVNQISGLATEERELAAQSKEHAELLFGLDAVRISLEESERRLLAAGKLLEGGQTGSAAQRAEQLALARLEGMLQAFAQTANDAAPKPNNQPPPGAPPQNNQQQQQRRPTFQLLQAKMLRMLQADLTERTETYRKRLAAANAADAGNNAAEKAELRQEAQELAAEQGRLVELVEAMLKRDNEKRQE